MSDGCGANETGCGLPIANPAIRKAVINTTFRMVAISWKVPECLMPVSCTSETSQTVPTASTKGGAPGNPDLPYSPKAMAASATGAEKPPVAETKPARNPKAG